MGLFVSTRPFGGPDHCVLVGQDGRCVIVPESYDFEMRSMVMAGRVIGGKTDWSRKGRETFKQYADNIRRAYAPAPAFIPPRG